MSNYLIYGANGYTAQLIAREAAARGMPDPRREKCGVDRGRGEAVWL